MLQFSGSFQRSLGIKHVYEMRRMRGDILPLLYLRIFRDEQQNPLDSGRSATNNGLPTIFEVETFGIHSPRIL